MLQKLIGVQNRHVRFLGIFIPVCLHSALTENLSCKQLAGGSHVQSIPCRPIFYSAGSAGYITLDLSTTAILAMLFKYYSDLFAAAQRLTTLRSWLLGVLVAVLFASAYGKGYLLYVLSLLALILQVIVWRQAYVIRKYNQLAHEIQRVQLFEKHFGGSAVAHEISHLKAKAVALLNGKEVDSTQRTADNQPLRSKGSNSLLKEIHENAFWNHHTYSTCYRRYRLIACGMLSAVGLSLLIALPLLDKEPAGTLLRLAFSLFSFAVVYETIDTAIGFSRAADAMLEIDNQAQQLQRDLSTETALALFAKYHYWKSSCGSVPYAIYSRMRNGLNNAWNGVASNLYGEG